MFFIFLFVYVNKLIDIDRTENKSLLININKDTLCSN